MRRHLVIGLALGVVLLAVPASASDLFRDVGRDSEHHDAVSELAGAGVTLGCRAGEYCPRDPVRRDQMASFLVRGLPRSGFNVGPTDLVPVDDGLAGVTASAAVRTPGGRGGRSTVVLQGTVTVFSDDEDIAEHCPCEIEAFVYRQDGGQGPSSWTQLPGELAGTGRANVALPVSWAVELASGHDVTFRIGVFLNGSGPDRLRAEGTLAAVTAPFGEVPRE